MSGDPGRPPAADALRVDEIRARLADLPDPLAFLEALFAHSPVGFQIYRADGHSALTNKAFRELFGSEPPPEYNVLRDEIAAATGTLDLIHRAFAGEVITTPPVWYDARELRQVTVTEARRVAIEASFFPLPDRGGRVAFVGIAFRDVTAEMEAREAAERRRAEAEAAELRMSYLARASAVLARPLDPDETLRELARLAVPHLADACTVLVAGDDGQLRRVAEAALDNGIAEVLHALRGMPVGTGGAHPVGEAFRERRVLLFPDYAAAASERLGSDHEYTRRVREIAPASVIVAPLMARGRALGAIVLGRLRASGRQHSAEDARLAEDLGRRAGLALDNVRLMTEAQAARAAAEAGSRAKDDFLALLGHELRNPLAPILTALELMRVRDPEALPQEREVIARQVSHLVRLVDDLLDVSRITRGKIALRRERLDVAALLSRAVEMAQPFLEQRQHRLAVEAPEGLAVEGDEHRLSQAVANLLTNAAKYTEPGGSVHLAAADAGGAVEIRVRDTGIGIAPDLLPWVFESFVQGRRSIDRAEGGLGLGLTIVKAVTEMHGGTVSASSAGVGRGSEFTLRLPLAPGAPSRALPSAGGQHSPADPAAEAPAPLRVLIVDDNVDAAELMGQALAQAGFHTAVALDGPSALTVAQQLRPQAALLDLGLPGMDGYELAGRLRGAGLGPLVLIAVTGYGQAQDRQRAREAGFDEHLVKPVEVARLAALLRSLAGRLAATPGE